MEKILNFNTEVIALFDLTLLGQETYICIGKSAFLLLPYYRLGHYDDQIGMSHVYETGYLVFEKVSSYKVEIIPHKDGIIEYDDKIAYEMIFSVGRGVKTILMEDLGCRPTGLVSYSLEVFCQSVVLLYNAISKDCLPTKYSDVVRDENTMNFLLNPNLIESYKMILSE